MKKRRLSVTWGLLATSAIFFIFGKFIAPEYESKFVESGIFEEVYPVSKYSLMFSGFLGCCFVLFLLFQLIRQKK